MPAELGGLAIAKRLMVPVEHTLAYSHVSEWVDDFHRLNPRHLLEAKFAFAVSS